MVVQQLSMLLECVFPELLPDLAFDQRTLALMPKGSLISKALASPALHPIFRHPDIDA
jgi:hypothetical protein